jgi:hypothetical protein
MRNANLIMNNPTTHTFAINQKKKKRESKTTPKEGKEYSKKDERAPTCLLEKQKTEKMIA